MTQVQPISKEANETCFKELNKRVGEKLNAQGSTALLILMAFGLTGCGGSSSGVGSAIQQSFSAGGTAVKGPLSNAIVFIVKSLR